MTQRVLLLDWQGTSQANQSKHTVSKLSYPGSLRSSPNSFSAIRSFLKKNLNTQDVLLSRDHAITFFGLEQCQQHRPLGVIVVDQHLDLYSEYYHGKKLNKANVFRLALQKKLIDHVVFVGIRPSELLLYQQSTCTKVEDLLTSQDRRKGILFRSKNISIIPLTSPQSIISIIKKSLDVLASKGIHHVALDIDLDAFDSKHITGVDYNGRIITQSLTRLKEIIKNTSKHSLDSKKINSFVQSKPLAKENIRAYLNQLYLSTPSLRKDIEDGLWYSIQLSQKGLSHNIPVSFGKEIQKKLQQNKQQVMYKGITEYMPEYDNNKKTAKLVTQLIYHFNEMTT